MEESNISKIDLSTFFLSVSTSAMMCLGDRGEGQVDLTLARQNIDLLELLEEKTQGNRTPEEEELLKKLLFDIRMRFLDCQKNS